MSPIIFTEDRRLTDDTIVRAGEERDFGEAENAAFVRNGVAAFKAEQAAAPDTGTAGYQPAEEDPTHA